MGYYNYTPEKNIWADRVVKWVADIVAIAVLAFFLALYLGDRVNVIGSSMSPALNSGETVLVDKMSYEISAPKRFDIIVYQSKTDASQYYFKRIIGLPGETVLITDSTIYITSTSGEMIELEDKYCNVDKYESGQADEPVKIGTDEYFVLGDNRNLSEDSRFSYVGNIKMSEILGKAWFIGAPFSQIGPVR